MSTKSKNTSSNRSHDRSALIQWVAIGLVVILGLIAALVLTEGGRGGGHSGAPASAQEV